MKIGILGAGAYGTALGSILEQNDEQIRFFDPYKFPERPLAGVLEFSEILILAIPSETVEETLAQIPENQRTKPLIVATKGIMSEQVYRAKFDQIEIMSGPGFASELRAGKKITLTVARREPVTSGPSFCERIFQNKTGETQVQFDSTQDLAGVLMLGGLKNIYAIGAGERRLNGGSTGFKDYIMQVARESEEFLVANGGARETIRLAAGLGDLILTCGSSESRNYSFGLRHYQKKAQETVEGLSAAREIERRKLMIPEQAEILRAILTKIKNRKEV